MTTTALHCTLALLLFLICAAASLGQETDKLPHVLIIGDSVYAQHAQGAVSELKDRATVQIAIWPNQVLPSSTSAIAHIDQLLGRKDRWGNDVPEDKWQVWDLIHFNVGLGDLVYCVPEIKSHRVLPHNAGGVIRTNKQEYENNLQALLRLFREKAPAAKPVWASTTPIRHSRENVFKPGDEVEYNQIAVRVMQEHGVPINDMHAYAVSFMDMEKPAGHGVDPFYFDKNPLHPPVVNCILQSLRLPAEKP